MFKIRVFLKNKNKNCVYEEIKLMQCLLTFDSIPFVYVSYTKNCMDYIDTELQYCLWVFMCVTLSLSLLLREEYRLCVTEKSVLRNIFKLMWDKVTRTG